MERLHGAVAWAAKLNGRRADFALQDIGLITIHTGASTSFGDKSTSTFFGGKSTSTSFGGKSTSTSFGGKSK